MRISRQSEENCAEMNGGPNEIWQWSDRAKGTGTRGAGPSVISLHPSYFSSKTQPERRIARLSCRPSRSCDQRGEQQRHVEDLHQISGQSDDDARRCRGALGALASTPPNVRRTSCSTVGTTSA